MRWEWKQQNYSQNCRTPATELQPQNCRIATAELQPACGANTHDRGRFSRNPPRFSPNPAISLAKCAESHVISGSQGGKIGCAVLPVCSISAHWWCAAYLHTRSAAPPEVVRSAAGSCLRQGRAVPPRGSWVLVVQQKRTQRVPPKSGGIVLAAQRGCQVPTP